jgi:hypothetical protein
MSASPSEVANDLDAQAVYIRKRDADLFHLCRDSARLIRQMLAGEKIDGRTWGGVHRRLCNRTIGRDVESQIGKSLARGLATLTALRAATS